MASEYKIISWRSFRNYCDQNVPLGNELRCTKVDQWCKRSVDCPRWKRMKDAPKADNKPTYICTECNTTECTCTQPKEDIAPRFCVSGGYCDGWKETDDEWKH